MSKRLREYQVPGKGPVLLACGKCQKKLTGTLRKVKKSLKRQAGNDLRVLQVGCMKLCPKGGVVVCTQEQVSRGVCSIVWSAKDLSQLAAGRLADAPV